jgi:hypothetical protein
MDWAMAAATKGDANEVPLMYLPLVLPSAVGSGTHTSTPGAAMAM